MTKIEWIDRVTEHIQDEFQKAALRRQLDEKIEKLKEKGDEHWALEQLGDPDLYYEKNYGPKSGKKVSLIFGVVMILIGGALILLNLYNGDNPLLHQIQTSSIFGYNAYSGYGLALGLGIISLLNGLRRK
ncbi:MAG: hypothetical protein KBT01_02935 [Clostridiales bacterium]|nr:hypothetical protein [Candidatus Blautia equi]